MWSTISQKWESAEILKSHLSFFGLTEKKAVSAGVRIPCISPSKRRRVLSLCAFVYERSSSLFTTQNSTFGLLLSYFKKRMQSNSKLKCRHTRAKANNSFQKNNAGLREGACQFWVLQNGKPINACGHQTRDSSQRCPPPSLQMMLIVEIFVLELFNYDDCSSCC